MQTISSKVCCPVVRSHTISVPTGNHKIKEIPMKSTSLCALIFALAPVALAQSVAGLWQATLTTREAEVPFRLEIAGTGSNVQGWFFNGDQKVRSTSGRLENGKLVLNFDHYASRLEATLKNGVLEGHLRPLPGGFAQRRAGGQFIPRHDLYSAAQGGSRRRSFDRWPVGDSTHPEQEARGVFLAFHRAPVRGGHLRGHPANRRGHGGADRHISGRQVRAEPLLRRPPGAPRSDGGRATARWTWCCAMGTPKWRPETG
jgi:hypothetical protein